MKRCDFASHYVLMKLNGDNEDADAVPANPPHTHEIPPNTIYYHGGRKQESGGTYWACIDCILEYKMEINEAIL